MILAAIAALFVAAILVGAMRSRPILRVAVRGFLRRPGQSALVVGGLLVASLVMAASLVAGDAQQAMFDENVYQAWGPVDLVLGSLSGRPFDENLGRRALDSSEVRDLSDAGSVRLQLPAALESPERKTREPLVNLIGIDAKLESSFGAFVSDEQGPIPLGPGTAVINERLARRLRVAAGDRIVATTVSLEGKVATLQLSVASVVRDEELGNWQLRPDVFVSLDSLQASLKGRGQINQVLLSAGGPPRAPRQAGALKDAAVTKMDQLAGVPATKSPQGYRVAGSKAQALRSSEESTRFFRTVLGSLGGLVALTSVALIVNLFVMLGEERRSELGTLRALGLRRRGLILLGLTEGMLYSVTASVAGAIIGAFLGRYLAGAMLDVFSGFVRDAAIEFVKPRFEFRAATLLAAGGAGFLISAISVAVVSYRTSRLTIVAAIRGLPERRTRRRRRWLAGGFLGLGIVMLAVGIAGVKILTLIGGTLMILGFTGIAGRRLKQRATVTAGTSVVVAFGLWSFVFLPDFDKDINSAFAIVTLAAIVVTLAAVVLIAANLPVFARLAAPFGPRARAVIRTATAYPVSYRFRTGMSMAMFALVLYMVAAFAVWGGLGGGDFEGQAGGFDVLARSSFPVEAMNSAGAETVVGMYATRYDGGYKVGSSQEIRFPALLLGVDQRLADTARFQFTEKLQGMSGKEVLQQLASRKDAAIIDLGTNPGGAKVGQSLEIRTDKGPVKFEVIGILSESYIGGLFISKQAFAGLYPNRANDLAWLARAKPDVSARALSDQIEAEHPGVDARSVREIFDENAQGQRTFVGIFQILLKLGLVIGISGLAIASIRTVLERRQAVGVLRALGFQRSMVGAWLILETVLVATLGCAVGLTTGLVGTYLLVSEQVPNLHFDADWSQVFVTLGIVYLASLAFTAMPAWRASSLRPSEAVRYVE